jgi:DNA invertase Pin-like site-specific DNA recombinase
MPKKEQRVALYLRVSTSEQMTNNQRHEPEAALSTALYGVPKLGVQRSENTGEKVMKVYSK